MRSVITRIKDNKKTTRILVSLATLSACLLAIVTAYQWVTRLNLNPDYRIGEVIDSLHGVNVYYNGGVNHVEERNTSADGYNIGLKYQCVEFVKRYYYERLGHRMPDSYGHAKDFFDGAVSHGELNSKRGLLQFRNAGTMPPGVGDLVVYRPTVTNPYGHVAIVSRIDFKQGSLEIIQQNAGPFSSTRETYPLIYKPSGTWQVASNRILGWLRKK
ncbi:CHAP domain-containing protein [Microbulbifer sp. OS29]|uniref:CHAP domain-containing protein n=1 Tax=Microbulbifer okhotskensis TaxID=2926617 RepID=A0A9X2J6W7_9GAMM|nr:CHAP domain-containing protein [Microbulbifer okhotskensis]MCO1336658.1 CHAP domain-containing protein [Microbulbifer okhotskensis]